MERGTAEAPRPRVDGYAPLREYAAIGDGRTVALVASDGAIDWWPVPDLDSPSVFGAILDARSGGRFELVPDTRYRIERRYLPRTNVLETTFLTDTGAVRVTDALSLPNGRLDPYRELQRRIDGVAGRVALRWRLDPRFNFARASTRLSQRSGFPIATAGADAIALRLFDAGEPVVDGGSWNGCFEATAGSSALLVLAFAHQEPLVIPTRAEADRRFNDTCATWRRWADGRRYDGPWRDAVIRSALLLKLLVHAPSGAVAAAATASLPEEIGGERNWDYRYSWIRDSAFTINAFLQLACPAEAHAYFWWLMHATQLTAPRLRVLYRLNGSSRTTESTLPLAGYRGSQPVNVGNGAADQLQLDLYGELLQTAWLYHCAGNRIDRDVGRRLAGLADYVCDKWREPDAGIWEVRSDRAHFTQSKMMCGVALERAVALAERNVLPWRNTGRWRMEANRIGEFVESRCWSERKQSYVRFAGTDELDASILLGVLHGYGAASAQRLHSTVAAVRQELTEGMFVRRYKGADGVAGFEGAFLACSFWLVEALARFGQRDEAAGLMSDLITLANDVGVYSEEADPETGEFLGNMPQALTHLALIGAAVALAEGT